MAQLLQFISSGLTVGAIYALVGLGFTLIYKASDIINFAQGEFVMLGGMTTVFVGAAGVPLEPSRSRIWGINLRIRAESSTTSTRTGLPGVRFTIGLRSRPGPARRPVLYSTLPARDSRADPPSGGRSLPPERR